MMRSHSQFQPRNQRQANLSTVVNQLKCLVLLSIKQDAPLLILPILSLVIEHLSLTILRLSTRNSNSQVKKSSFSCLQILTNPPSKARNGSSSPQWHTVYMGHNSDIVIQASQQIAKEKVICNRHIRRKLLHKGDINNSCIIPNTAGPCVHFPTAQLHVKADQEMDFQHQYQVIQAAFNITAMQMKNVVYTYIDICVHTCNT